MSVDTKSCQVTCPDCRNAFLVAVSRETDHLSLECQICEESILLPAAAFRPDERTA
jgi:ribosomal protein S27E